MIITPTNDFGFTAMSSEQLRQSLPVVESASRARALKDARVKLIIEAITPLLEALMRDPEKDKLHWPRRAEVAQKILDRIKDISEGKEDDVAQRQATQEHNSEGIDVNPDGQ